MFWNTSDLSDGRSGQELLRDAQSPASRVMGHRGIRLAPAHEKQDSS